MPCTFRVKFGCKSTVPLRSSQTMYQTPGVSIKDLPLGNRSVTAASTSIPAFLGHVKRGQRVTDKDGEPVLIRSVSQYGPLVGDPGGISKEGETVDAFGHAINAFFANGGSQAYVVPVAKTADKVSTCSLSSKPSLTRTSSSTPSHLTPFPPANGQTPCWYDYSRRLRALSHSPLAPRTQPAKHKLTWPGNSTRPFWKPLPGSASPRAAASRSNTRRMEYRPL